MADLKVLASLLVQELSILAASALSIMFLALGALGTLDDELAVGLALGFGVAQLVGWGIEMGRQSGQGWRSALLPGWSTVPRAW